MSISSVPGRRLAGSDVSFSAPVAVSAHAPSFARRLARQRESAPSEPPPTRASGKPSASMPHAARRLGSRAQMPKTGSAPRATTQSRLSTICTPRRTPVSTHSPIPSVVQATVQRLMPQLLREIALRAPADRRKRFRTGYGRAQVTVTVDGLGDITITLSETPHGWAVSVQADPLLSCLKSV